MWTKKSVEKFEVEVIGKLKKLFDRWVEIEAEVVEAKMPEFWISWSAECDRAISTLTGAARNTAHEIDDQITCFQKNIPCTVELTKKKNAKAKKVAETKNDSDVAVAVRTQKKTAKKTR